MFVILRNEVDRRCGVFLPKLAPKGHFLGKMLPNVSMT